MKNIACVIVIGLMLLPFHIGQGQTQFLPEGIRVHNMEWSPDGQKIAMASMDHGAWIWANGALWPLPTQPWPDDIAWGPDSMQLAVLGRGSDTGHRFIEILDVSEPSTPQLIRSFQDTNTVNDGFENIDWHPSLNLVAISGSGIRIWDTDTGQLVHHLLVEGNETTSNVQWAPDGSSVIALHPISNLIQWDGVNGVLIQDIFINTIMITWGEHSQQIALTWGGIVSDGFLHIVDLSQPEVVLSNIDLAYNLTILDWEGDTLAGYSGGGNLHLWDVPTGQIITSISNLSWMGFALDPHGGRLAYVADNALEILLVPRRPQAPLSTPSQPR